MYNILIRKWYQQLLQNKKILNAFSIKYFQDTLILYPNRENIFDFDQIKFQHTKIGFDGGTYGQPIITIDQKQNYTFPNFEKVENHLEEISNKLPEINYDDKKAIY